MPGGEGVRDQPAEEEVVPCGKEEGGEDVEGEGCYEGGLFWVRN